jgi:hypothetical protein
MELATLTRATLHARHLEIPKDLELLEWRELMRKMQQLKDAADFATADLVQFGREKYGAEMVEQVLLELRFTASEIRNGQLLLNLSYRAEGLTKEHHLVLAKANQPSQDHRKWIDLAEKEKLSPLELKKSIEAGKVVRIDGTKPPADEGVPTPHAVAVQFSLYEREIAKRGVEKFPVEALEMIVRELQGVEAFVAKCRSLIAQHRGRAHEAPERTEEVRHAVNPTHAMDTKEAALAAARARWARRKLEKDARELIASGQARNIPQLQAQMEIDNDLACELWDAIAEEPTPEEEDAELAPIVEKALALPAKKAGLTVELLQKRLKLPYEKAVKVLGLALAKRKEWAK